MGRRNLGIADPALHEISLDLEPLPDPDKVNNSPAMERPSKRAKLLSDDEESDSNDVALPKSKTNGFRVNEEYARRFEHNEKRREQHQLEEKYGKDLSFKSRGKGDAPDDDESSSSDESEDDEAELATEAVDDEILATLEAIRKKDPRVYNKDIKFYKEYDPEQEEAKERQEKPMYLSDYHRKNLLEGHAGGEEEEGKEDVPKTYAQEQDRMRRELVGEMHAVANGTSDADDAEEEDDADGLLVAKSRPQHETLPATSTKARKTITDADVAAADKDPETYLSNFMASRAWLPTETSKWQAFDSDDSEDDARAEKFEEAYNMRFEDPGKANEELRTFARDTGKYSVRRDEKKTSRQRNREREREKKEAEKREREEDKARLRNLRVEEMEAKVKRIREAAGLGKGEEVDIDAWKDVLEGDFEDGRWEKEMEKRFGDRYYAAKEEDGVEDGEDEGDEVDEDERRGKKRRLHKPKWDDDIDINDLVPEFEDDEKTKPNFTLSDDDEQDADGGDPVLSNNVRDEDPSDPADDDNTSHPTKPKSKKDRARAKADAKRTARRERAAIENLVDASLPLDPVSTATTSHSNTSAGGVPGFRYRATSPTTFGLSARDILFADDAQLNEFAGLKKLAAWREEEKKARDRKRFSKKGRLREWRRGVFGSVEGPKVGVGGGGEERGAGVDGEGTRKKRKRSKKGKASAA